MFAEIGLCFGWARPNFVTRLRKLLNGKMLPTEGIRDRDDILAAIKSLNSILRQYPKCPHVWRLRAYLYAKIVHTDGMLSSIDCACFHTPEGAGVWLDYARLGIPTTRNPELLVSACNVAFTLEPSSTVQRAATKYLEMIAARHPTVLGCTGPSRVEPEIVEQISKNCGRGIQWRTVMSDN